MPEAGGAFIVACAQFTPAFLSREGTIDRACQVIAEAGDRGVRLLAFPESFVPGYPDWVWAVPAGEDALLAGLYAELLENAIDIPSPAIDRLCGAAKQAGVHVVIGMTERNVEASGASLFNTLLTIDDRGVILGKHRKLIPTGGERLVWAPGDGSTLAVYDTALGRLGGLICWENYMPLARYALYAWGVQLLVAATWDRGEPWLSTVRHIAKEGGVYVLNCGMPLRKADLLDRLGLVERYYVGTGEWINGGDSAIVDPEGTIIAGPMHKQEGLLMAEVDPARMRGPRWMLDVAGHYARPDVFQLTVDISPRPMIRTVSPEAISLPADPVSLRGEPGEV
jgi:nitrilase